MLLGNPWPLELLIGAIWIDSLRNFTEPSQKREVGAARMEARRGRDVEVGVDARAGAEVARLVERIHRIERREHRVGVIARGPPAPADLLAGVVLPQAYSPMSMVLLVPSVIEAIAVRL